MAALDFQKQFSKYKDILMEEIIQEFGEEYRDIIIERINSHVIILQSNPLDDYTYLCKHADKIKFTDRFIIKERHRKLERIKKKIRNDLMHEFLWMIKVLFKIDENIIFGKDSNELVSLFGNENFDTSYVDSYNSVNMNLLNRIDTPEIVKENIFNDQRILKEGLEKYGIIIDEDFISQVDNFIDKRNLEKGEYYRRILKSNSSYNKELSQYLSVVNPAILFRISFYQSPHRDTVLIKNQIAMEYVFCPITRLINLNLKGLDIVIIHELVHTVAKEKRHSIMNEVIVQKAAINITRRLHDKGIFMFDNPDDYRIGDECGYELLFPIIEPILSNYDDILKGTLINGSFYSLDEVFGESWNNFLMELENLLSNFQNMYMRSKEHYTWQTDLSNLKRYMSEMDDFYHRGGKHV